MNAAMFSFMYSKFIIIFPSNLKNIASFGFKWARILDILQHFSYILNYQRKWRPNVLKSV